MSALDDLVTEVRSLLASHGGYSPKVTWLKAGCSASDLTVSVDQSPSLGTGVVEIGNEALYVRKYDDATGTLEIAPDGRGWDGTTAAAHEANARVTIEPVHPRQSVVRAIYEAVDRLWPTVFGVSTYTFTYVAGRETYDMPDDFESPLRVDVQSWDGEWETVSDWSTRHTAADDRSLTVRCGIPGRSVRVVYAHKARTAPLSASGWESTGLSPSARQAVIYAVTAKLVRFTETGRLTSPAASSDQYEGAKPFYTTSIKVATDLEQQYQVSLAEERKRLRSTYPPRIVRTR